MPADKRSAKQVNCALCCEPRALRNSHVIPAFFGRYLKETSATGFLRGAVSPNKRVQDLAKEFLLCEECEQRFSGWEREFSGLALPVVQGDDFRVLRYGPWMLPFIVSLSWRVLVSDRDDLLQGHSHFTEEVGKVLESWRLFLLGRRRDPGTEHHVFVFAGVPTSVPDDAERQLLHYMLRTIDATEGISSRTLFVYVKALRTLVFSPIVPRYPSGWKNTRIHPGTASLRSPQRIFMKGFGDFLSSRVKEAFSTPLSAAQQGKIREAMLSDPRKALSSESYRVHKATQKLFGAETGSEGDSQDE